ncbi:MAG: hypothetical protein IJ851_03020 [Eubacterium sp.]|nr:hypothetical protein [Eubacterium sp.]
MAKTIPMIITNSDILVKEKDSDEFKAFQLPSIQDIPNIPFYHIFAERIAESQYYFKEFMKELYGKKLSKYILAIIVPDDTSKLESIFINEFFVNSGACKAVAQMPMALALSKEDNNYISISKSQRNVILEYIKDREIIVKKQYNADTCTPMQILRDAKVVHIDVEYDDIPVYVNNFNLNMDDYLEMGEIIGKKRFLQKIAQIDVEKL